ncbi:hypothetical protein PENTCL1PPCAC_8145, partial [Pristionchus entomophagus]
NLENIVLNAAENEHDDGDHELKDLRGSDGFGDCSGNLHIDRAEEVIGVHEGMNDQVEVGQVSVEGGRCWIRVESVHQSEDVVIPVEEEEGFLAEHLEESVSELGQFAQHEDEHPESIGSRGHS